MKTVSLFRVVDGLEISTSSILTDEQYEIFEELSKEFPDLTKRELLKMTTNQKTNNNKNEIPT